MAPRSPNCRRQAISDDLLRRLWTEVDRLHRAGMAHRSLRAANVMVDGDVVPWLTDFSFPNWLPPSGRRTSTSPSYWRRWPRWSARKGLWPAPRRSLGAEAMTPAVPLLQPPALSAATRRAIGRNNGLLAETRAAAAAASGLGDQPLARLQRVRLKNLLAIAAAAGAFYFILPQLAHVGSSWQHCSRCTGYGCRSSSPHPP